jgi:hypothetical protein
VPPGQIAGIDSIEATCVVFQRQHVGGFRNFRAVSTPHCSHNQQEISTRIRVVPPRRCGEPDESVVSSAGRRPGGGLGSADSQTASLSAHIIISNKAGHGLPHSTDLIEQRSLVARSCSRGVGANRTPHCGRCRTGQNRRLMEDGWYSTIRPAPQAKPHDTGTCTCTECAW